MSYNPTDWYGSLRVQPDHNVIYEGKAQMGAGLASGINSLTGAFLDDRKEQNRMAHNEAMLDKQQAGQMSMLDSRHGFEEMMFGKRETSDANRRKEDKAAQEAEVARFGDNMLSAAFSYAQGIAPGVFNEETFALFQGIQDPKVKAEMGKQIINLAADKMRSAQEQEKAILKAQESRQTFTLTDPLTGKPDEGYFMTGNNMALPRHAARPQGAPQPTAEQMMEMGLIPDSATVGGIKFTTPKAPAPEPTYAQDADGKIIKIAPGYEVPEGYKPMTKKETTPDGKPVRTSGLKLY